MLDVQTLPEQVYTNSLDKLNAEMSAIHDAIRSAEDLISQGYKTSDSIFTSTLTGHVQALKNTYKALANIAVAAITPPFTPGPNDLPCQCNKNKRARLRLLRLVLPGMVSDCNKLEEQLGIDLDDFGKIAWAEVTLMAVEGLEAATLLTGEFPLTILGSVTAGVLLHLAPHTTDGERAYSFGQSLYMLAKLKAAVICYDIYYEQMRKSRICQA